MARQLKAFRANVEVDKMARRIWTHPGLLVRLSP
jgi:hypothetical protein